MAFAPIALFAFRRPAHLARVLDALERNPEFAASPLHVFADGPRAAADLSAVEATRELIRRRAPPGAEVRLATSNRGLSASVIAGISELCARHGRAIAIEDDVVVSSTFLRYVNEALDRYAHDESVFSVSGYMYPCHLPTGADATFLPLFSPWGWATWDRAWRTFDTAGRGHARLVADRRLRRRFDLGGRYPFFEMLCSQRAGRVDSWAIRSYLTLFTRGQLSLFPRRSLVANEGFDGSGVNCGDAQPAYTASRAEEFLVERYPERTVADEACFDTVARFMGRDYTLRGRFRGAVRARLRRATRFATALRRSR